MLMEDKNGVEIKNGDLVRITGAYFKNANGLWRVEHAPGDKNWCGHDYCLKRVNKDGTDSKRKDNICFWPIATFVNSAFKRTEARLHNEKYAQIEVLR